MNELHKELALSYSKRGETTALHRICTGVKAEANLRHFREVITARGLLQPDAIGWKKLCYATCHFGSIERNGNGHLQHFVHQMFNGPM